MKNGEKSNFRKFSGLVHLLPQHTPLANFIFLDMTREPLEEVGSKYRAVVLNFRQRFVLFSNCL